MEIPIVSETVHVAPKTTLSDMCVMTTRYRCWKVTARKRSREMTKMLLRDAITANHVIVLRVICRTELRLLEV